MPPLRIHAESARQVEQTYLQIIRIAGQQNLGDAERKAEDAPAPLHHGGDSSTSFASAATRTWCDLTEAGAERWFEKAWLEFTALCGGLDSRSETGAGRKT